MKNTTRKRNLLSFAMLLCFVILFCNKVEAKFWGSSEDCHTDVVGPNMCMETCRTKSYVLFIKVSDEVTHEWVSCNQ